MGVGSHAAKTAPVSAVASWTTTQFIKWDQFCLSHALSFPRNWILHSDTTHNRFRPTDNSGHHHTQDHEQTFGMWISLALAHESPAVSHQMSALGPWEKKLQQMLLLWIGAKRRQCATCQKKLLRLKLELVGSHQTDILVTTAGSLNTLCLPFNVKSFSSDNNTWVAPSLVLSAERTFWHARCKPCCWWFLSFLLFFKKCLQLCAWTSNDFGISFNIWCMHFWLGGERCKRSFSWKLSMCNAAVSISTKTQKCVFVVNDSADIHVNASLLFDIISLSSMINCMLSWSLAECVQT